MNEILSSGPSESPAEHPMVGEIPTETIGEGSIRESRVKRGDLDAEIRRTQTELPTLPSGAPANVPTVDATPKPEAEGFFASSLEWIKSTFDGAVESVKDAAKWFCANTGGFGKWLQKTFGSKAENPVTPDVQTAQATSTLEAPPEGISVNSWDEVMAIADLPTRVLQATLFAKATEMNCFVLAKGKLENHCSGWCQSVFQKCGLDLYDEKPRLFCDGWQGWGKKGTLNGLKLKPGYSVIYTNEDGGPHQDIILSSEGPDAEGNYRVTNLGQTKSYGDGTGERKVRTMTIPAKNIHVVIAPGATQPWTGDGSNLVG